MLSYFKAKQQFLLWSLVITLLLIIIVLIGFLMNPRHAANNATKTEKKSLATGASRVNPQEIWVHKFSTDADLTHKRLELIEQSLDKLLKLGASTQQPDIRSSHISNTEMGHLRQEVANTLQDPISKIEGGTVLPMPQTGQNLNAKETVGTDTFRSKSVQKISLNLHNARHQQFLKTVDNTIPAGAFAQGILLGGVDASTSIQASSDPRPILLRLTNPGTLPRRFRSDLKGCHVLAASFGDLSSERVFMRLEKLSCVERKTGEVIEMNVQGYVAGEDGRAGLRGRLVDKSTESMRNAMVGGFFSSVGNFLGQPRTPLLFSPATGLAQSNPLTSSDILKQSAGNGVSGALDKYAEFYIKRAEQMQPVIQVPAGRRADIVFTQGIEFSDSAHRKAISRSNDQRRFQQVQATDDLKSSTEWSAQSEGEK